MLLLLFFVPLVSGATLHGEVYDLDFDIVNNVIVEINSEPRQSVIASDGSYSFELNIGSYVLLAKYYVGQELIASVEEEVEIVDEGDYVIDLILFPVFDSEIDEDIDVEFGESNGFNYWLIFSFVLIGLLALLFFKKKKPKKKFEEQDELEDVLRFIKKNGGRVTQKDIRKDLGLSEAKASLIITELEYKKIVQRIKKGRGNVIILNK